jgi:hypothetical protein
MITATIAGQPANLTIAVAGGKAGAGLPHSTGGQIVLRRRMERMPGVQTLVRYCEQ